MKQHAIKVVRIILLVLIVIGVGLLVTQAYWVNPLVQAILSHEAKPVLVPVASTTTLPATSSKPPKTTPPVVPPVVSSSGVGGVATIGPTCPVVQNPPNPACADKPYETTLVLTGTVTGKNGGVLVHTDSQGRFSQDLAPGTYTLRAQSDAMLPRLTPVTFEVTANNRTKVALQFDSGIR